jgi:hypothetical protein
MKVDFTVSGLFMCSVRLQKGRSHVSGNLMPVGVTQMTAAGLL